MLKRIFGYFMDSIQTVVFILSLYIVVYIFFFMPSEVRGSSMEPTLHTKERLIINKIIYRFTTPKRGDIIVLKSPRNPDIDYIKRVVGEPQDAIRISGGALFVNGQKLSEPFTTAPTYSWDGGIIKEGEEYIVPGGHLFVLGDNRPRSSDSREFGFIPIESVEGRAVFRYFPPEKVGLL